MSNINDVFVFYVPPTDAPRTFTILKGREMSKVNQYHIKLDDFGGKSSRFTARWSDPRKKKDRDDDAYDDDIGKDVRPYTMSRMAHGKRHFPQDI